MTPDSSAIIAAFAAWHPVHEETRTRLRWVDELVGHAELEAYSVLTRLPAPYRAEPALVAEYLRRRYRGARLALSADGRENLVGRLAAAGIAGGKSYDALIAATAVEAGRELISCDARAASTYERMGARFQLIG